MTTTRPWPTLVGPHPQGAGSPSPSLSATPPSRRLQHPGMGPADAYVPVRVAAVAATKKPLRAAGSVVFVGTGVFFAYLVDASVVVSCVAAAPRLPTSQAVVDLAAKVDTVAAAPLPQHAALVVVTVLRWIDVGNVDPAWVDDTVLATTAPLFHKFTATDVDAHLTHAAADAANTAHAAADGADAADAAADPCVNVHATVSRLYAALTLLDADIIAIAA
eukprot:TRINITY_DN3926_c0_g1_i1.p1 TRINITY_DN3926_c0_g1~~TRINITY_DN3926_c0_g1_i1.p1  ORF type:complete len:219 (-),score=36.42 TRINITY_DN3926_c0_g1_i1:884-1540(-)